jgi:2,4-dienoyl-CoA reductase (NADPH2)
MPVITTPTPEARELLREPYWDLKAQQALGQEPDWPIQCGYAVKYQAQ